MPNGQWSAKFVRSLAQVRNRFRERRLEAGEAGWGQARPSPPRIRGTQAGRRFRVGVIGAGNQGVAHAAGMTAVPGIAVVGLADVLPAKLESAAARLQLPASACFSDAAEMVTRLAPLDLVSVATTAPSQVAVGRTLLDLGVPRIVLEKPMGTSVLAAAALVDRSRQAQAVLAVNYSRRWLIDYRSIKACIADGAIGALRTIMIAIGRGEVGMHASHYFDVCRFLLAAEPESVAACLDPVREANPRGGDFHDPSGYCLVRFDNGARAYIDFSADLLRKDAYLVLKGTTGRITVDETRMVWTLQSRSQRTWEFPFLEPIKSSMQFSRVAAELLSDVPPAASGDDGVAALSIIAATRLSGASARQIRFPLSAEQMCVEMPIP